MIDRPDATPPEPNGHATVRESMRTALITIERRAHLAAARYLMRRMHHTVLVVTTDDGRQRPIGILTDTDIAQSVADRRDLNETRIEELACLQPITVQPETLVSDAIALMVSAGVRYLPVVEDGRVVGVFGTTDADAAPSETTLPAQRQTPPG